MHLKVVVGVIFIFGFGRKGALQGELGELWRDSLGSPCIANKRAIVANLSFAPKEL
jgi:hypothetical protein